MKSLCQDLLQRRSNRESDLIIKYLKDNPIITKLKNQLRMLIFFSIIITKM